MGFSSLEVWPSLDIHVELVLEPHTDPKICHCSSRLYKRAWSLYITHTCPEYTSHYSQHPVHGGLCNCSIALFRKGRGQSIHFSTDPNFSQLSSICCWLDLQMWFPQTQRTGCIVSDASVSIHVFFW